MILSPCSRYLLFGVRFDAPSRSITFYENGTFVFDIDVCIAAEEEADAVYALDMRRFAGRTLEVRGLPEGAVPVPAEEPPHPTNLYTERCRPRLHFSADTGWINDPNGLVWDGSVYHLYFQHNPVGRCWGNMHWGHAVSEDLVHWQQLPGEALHPDETGTMFSGCGVLDADNASGLGDGQTPPLLFYYTAAGGANELSRAAGTPFTQCLAVSTDGGKTLVKYATNPIVPHIAGNNRDPKVVWCAAQDRWYMALYLDGNEFALLRSEDLLHWEDFQRLELPKDTECPDFYPLCEESTGEEYWIFSAAADYYLVGRLDAQGRFVPVQPVQRLHCGAHSYAAQTFFNTADGSRIRMGWCTAKFPGTPFNGSMNTPTRLTLHRKNDTLYLCAQPIEAFSNLRQEAVPPQWHADGSRRTLQTPGALYELDWSFVPVKDAEISLAGRILHLDAAAGVLRCAQDEKEYTVPLFAAADGRVHLRIIADTATVELYAGEGESFAVFALPEPGAANDTVTVCAADAFADEALTVYPLRPIR